jgi:hypothetical protein
MDSRRQEIITDLEARGGKSTLQRPFGQEVIYQKPWSKSCKLTAYYATALIAGESHVWPRDTLAILSTTGVYGGSVCDRVQLSDLLHYHMFPSLISSKVSMRTLDEGAWDRDFSTITIKL